MNENDIKKEIAFMKTASLSAVGKPIRTAKTGVARYTIRKCKRSGKDAGFCITLSHKEDGITIFPYPTQQLANTMLDIFVALDNLSGAVYREFCKRRIE